MKKIWLLTTLLIGSLLFSGCNYHQYEEEFSEYWLLQWPNGTITLEDFKKEWWLLCNSKVEDINTDKCVKLLDNWELCTSPEKACVPLMFKDDNTLVTPYEYNTFIGEWTGLTLSEWEKFTDLETFRKVTWLKEASPEYVQWAANAYYFDPYTKFYQTVEERKEMFKENLENKAIEEPVVEEKNYDENSWQELISQDCKHFFDGCNHCKRIVDWELVCSDLTCEEYGKPECTDFILEDMQ